MYAVRLHDPGVKLHVMTIVFSPSQVLLSAMILGTWYNITQGGGVLSLCMAVVV